MPVPARDETTLAEMLKKGGGSSHRMNARRVSEYWLARQKIMVVVPDRTDVHARTLTRRSGPCLASKGESW